MPKLAALPPRPEVHWLLYHGVLAPHAHWRQQVVGFGRSAASEDVAARRAERGGSRCPRYWAWATLRRPSRARVPTLRRPAAMLSFS